MCDCQFNPKQMLKEIKIMEEREKNKRYDYVFYTCNICKTGEHHEWENIRRCPTCKKYICYKCDNIKYYLYNVCSCDNEELKQCNDCQYYYCDNCKLSICNLCDDKEECPKCNNNTRYIIDDKSLCEICYLFYDIEKQLSK